VKIIVGLGNPGERYEGTRHNVGWRAVDEVARRHQVALTTVKFQALFGSGRLGDETVALLKPVTFMNDSGAAVQEATSFYNCPLDGVLVICDDINLPPGTLRARQEGSAGGHRGLLSIEERLGTQEYARLRIGIGRGLMEDQREYVLSRFAKEEEEIIAAAIRRAADAVECWRTRGIEACMNEFNVAGADKNGK
jgi:PTH1 family peptidyl-tRNA hydrolase